jgi:Flp pilus assembly protein TadD
MEEIEFYKEEVRKNPDDALAHNNLGIVYSQLGRHKEE